MTKFGVSQITKQTPAWAIWMYRVWMILTTATTFVVASDDTIPDNLALKITIYLKAADMVVFGISKLFGIRQENETQ